MFGHINLDFGNDRKFRIYKCSLCYALGKEYGITARLFTNYDMALCILVASSYGIEEVRVKRSICPALAINKILVNDQPVLRYAAALSILLVSEKVKDDIYDEGKRYPKKVMRWIESLRGKAVSVLKDIGFETGVMERAFETQRMLEKKGDIELLRLTESTATVMSEIYAHSATLTGIPEYKTAFRHIGYSLGQIVYLLDSIADYRHDLMRDTFNPLHKCFSCGRDVTAAISQDAKEKVFHLLKTFQMEIKRALQELPENPYLKNIFTNRLPKRLEEIFRTLSRFVPLEKATFTERVGSTLFFYLISSPRLAFASGRERSLGSECFESLILLVIMLVACSFICRLPFNRCFSSAPDRVTVDHGCEGKRTYKKRPCSDEYEDDRNRCC
jgi:hypothetical protein